MCRLQAMRDSAESIWHSTESISETLDLTYVLIVSEVKTKKPNTFANTNPCSKQLQSVNLGNQGYLFAEKTEGRKSRDTVPLM
jgi:hypothetical protein